ncbi:glycoside hydrolase domain-containing protein [Streptomyces sp. PT12]|uniref:glycoside hydrolase domain-containing protein n=1 Tax=Streptomyces sp. PT12 TaxID=1510197 RepID=UPI000DE24709|nr:glycoside hydrolase domain-containing protein [Streptomyces sp. PT12]RBM05664.1 peptidoglycan-binding protein [Streptomyces sp. PT12]
MRYAHHTGLLVRGPWLPLLFAFGALAATVTPALAGPPRDPRPGPGPVPAFTPERPAVPGRPALPERPATTSGDLTAAGAEIYEGHAFDTCDAPSAAALRDWLDSPYRAVGVYIGGRGRACPDQPNLTPDWVADVDSMGWRLLPLYVGSQAPCVRDDDKSRVPIDAARPRQRGAAEAADAIDAAESLGLAPGSPIYLDMEDYDQHDGACADITLAFVQAFSHHLTDRGWIPGFYSSATSGIAHLEAARLSGAADLPDVLWYARWRTAPTLVDEPVLDPGAWQPHRRIHQYEGDVTETHGGRRMRIDRNVVHAPVAVLNSDHQVNP